MGSFRRSVSLSLAILAGIGLSSPGWANVGVTSITSGNPVGQPPAQAERVLRVGVDVQANERVTTRAEDRAHLVFLDGTALTVGPNSTLVIDKFVYDPDRKLGELSISTAKGVFRLVGGNISKTNDIKVTTPSASIGIRGGIATFEVAEGGGTKATFLYGQQMTVTGQGQTQVATRHGSQISATTGRPPTPPAPVPPGGLAPVGSFEKPPANVVVNPAPPAPVPGQLRAPVVVPAQAPVVVPVQLPVASAAQINTALNTSALTSSNSGLRRDTLRQEARFNHQNRGHKAGNVGAPGGGRPGGGPALAGGARMGGPPIMAALRPVNVGARQVVANNAKVVVQRRLSGKSLASVNSPPVSASANRQ